MPMTLPSAVMASAAAAPDCGLTSPIPVTVIPRASPTNTTCHERIYDCRFTIYEPKTNHENQTQTGRARAAPVNFQPSTLNRLCPRQPHAAGRARADDEDARSGRAAHAD